MLHANGYRTLRSTDGNSAMTMISSHCPDLILLDLGLPDVDGLAVLESVRRWSMLPIVVVSARGHEHAKSKGAGFWVRMITSPSRLAHRNCMARIPNGAAPWSCGKPRGSKTAHAVCQW